MGRATGAGGGMTKGVEVADGRVVRFELGMGGAFGIGDRVPGERCLATDGVAGGELTKAAFDAVGVAVRQRLEHLGRWDRRA